MPVNLKDPAQRAAALENQKDVLRLRNEASRAVAAEERGTAEPPIVATLRDLLAQPDEPNRLAHRQMSAVESRVISRRSSRRARRRSSGT